MAGGICRYQRANLPAGQCRPDSYADFDVLPLEIPALSTLSVSVGYIVPDTLQSGRWVITSTGGNGVSFTLSFATEPLDLRNDGVDVRLVSVTYLEGQITTNLRIRNVRSEMLHFTQDDFWLALGYAPEPHGSCNPAEGLNPFDLLPEQTVDVTLVWYWNGEPYTGMGMGDYRFAIQLSCGSQPRKMKMGWNTASPSS